MISLNEPLSLPTRAQLRTNRNQTVDFIRSNTFGTFAGLTTAAGIASTAGSLMKWGQNRQRVQELDNEINASFSPLLVSSPNTISNNLKRAQRGVHVWSRLGWTGAGVTLAGVAGLASWFRANHQPKKTGQN